jgi:MFS family permease
MTNWAAEDGGTRSLHQGSMLEGRPIPTGPQFRECCKMSANIILGLLTVGSICSLYLAGRIAERRGRRFKIWAWIAAIIGPLALPLVFLFPNLHGKDGGRV